MEDAEWDRLIFQLKQGDCTPFLGAGACMGTLPTASELSRQWAVDHDYPFDDSGDLARVMQYVTARYGESVFVKQQLARQLGGLGAPDFGQPNEVHALLAQFPLPVYLTTNYDDFLVRALHAAGKNARTAICPWHGGLPYDAGLFNDSAGISPTESEPLIYYLHGRLGVPESLVLTEDDYLEFLISVTSADGQELLRLVPSAVLTALTTRPLLFVGYSLQDWTFRVLFHGLMRKTPSIGRRRHVSVQLPPPIDGSTPAAQRRATAYLKAYLENWKISIYWGTAEQFCAELRTRLGVAA